MADGSLVSAERIARSILSLRGAKVLLDADLAELYGVDTKTLVRAVRRNAERFPADFMFQLTLEEYHILRSQSGTSSSWGGRRYRPFAFTEKGVAMLSSVLRSPRAVRVNIEIMRAFVRLRRMLESNAELAHKLAALEQRYDAQFKVVFQAIRELMRSEHEPKRIGFGTARPIAEGADPLLFEARRGYATRAVNFRELVVGAYRERCSVCRLHHVELLDAAHILPDRDERGRPEVPNGLALCKIHHAAFDASILGISADYRIAIRRDVLEEVDGPMLLHGLQEMNKKSILVPASSRLKPNKEYLGERFERFRAA